MTSSLESTVWLVRHAKAGERHDWPGHDTSRPLTPAGRRQAEALVETLDPYGVRRATVVLSSDYLRCVETVIPLAVALAVPVTPEAALREGAPLAATLAAMASAGDAVLCSHGDVIGGVLEALLDAGVLRGHAPCAKGSTWMLSLRDGAVRAARHVLPPP